MGLGGGLALFLYGMAKVTQALKVVAGDHMKALLGRFTSNRFTGLLAGFAITMVTQSSSVTSVLVVGFISAGLMTLTQSVGVILGASIGSTVTPQIIAFKVTKSALALIGFGYLAEMTSKRRLVQHYGVEVARSKTTINTEIDRVRAHLLKRLTVQEPERLETFRLESDIVDSLKRLHTLARRIAKGVEDTQRSA